MNAPSLTLAARAAFALHLLVVVPVQAQEIIPPGPNGRGAILIYGNFCGPGNRGPGYRPIDALDLACAHHDACSAEPASGILTRCACHRRLQTEAGAVARDWRAPARTRQTAQFISDVAAALPCQ